MTESGFLTEVEGIAGAGAVAADVVAAGFDAAGCAGVVQPSDVASLAAVMRLCSDRGWPVQPAGAGTWLRPADWPDAAGAPAGSPPARPEPRAAAAAAAAPRRPLLVSTARLAAVLEHEPADLVIGVQAGMPLVALHEHLRRAGQRLPLDPPAATGATIGATIALGAAGPLSTGHGLPRDMALGLEAVTGDGRVLRFGGRVVKNVAGYDGVRLFTGSGGAFGIITAIFLRVRGAPRADATWSARAADATGAADLALAVRAVLDCDALELLSPTLAAAIGLDSAWTVLARVAGSDDAVAAALQRLDQAAARAGVTADEPVTGTVWDRIAHDEAGAGAHATFRAGAALMGQALREHERNLASDTMMASTGRVAAHAGPGLVRVWHDRAAPHRTAVTTVDAASLTIVRRLGAAFDPAGVLVPGRRWREMA
jgi:FAD/FMN-containing dehydrogenase